MSVIPSIHQIPPNARVLAYTRVSTEDQARGDAGSLSDQRVAATRFAHDRGVQVDHVIEDRASGRNVNRPGFRALIEFCERNPRPDDARGLVICLDSSRWGRFVDRPSLSATFKDNLYLVGWDLEFVREPSSGNLDADVFLASARGVASATESRRISYRAKMGMTAQAEAGHWQGRPPFGYVRVAYSPSTGAERTLAPYQNSASGERVKLALGDSRTQRTVCSIFRRFADGASLQSIADRLHRKKVPGPFDIYQNRKGINHWTLGTVKTLLINPVYNGTHRFNRRSPANAQGKRSVRARDEWIVMEDVHPKLIDDETWSRVQKRFADSTPHSPKSPYLLTGLLRCAACGGNVKGGGGSRPRDKDPGRYRFYRCSCSRPMLTVNQRWIDKKMVGMVSGHVSHAVKTGALAEILHELLSERSLSGSAQKAELEVERRDLEKRRDRLVDAIAKGTIEEDEATTHVRRIRDSLAEVKASLERSRFQDRAERLSAAERQAVLARAADFPARMGEAPPEVARQLIAPWVDSVVLDKVKRIATVRLRHLPADVFPLESPAAQP